MCHCNRRLLYLICDYLAHLQIYFHMLSYSYHSVQQEIKLRIMQRNSGSKSKPFKICYFFICHYRSLESKRNPHLQVGGMIWSCRNGRGRGGRNLGALFTMGSAFDWMFRAKRSSHTDTQLSRRC